MVSEGLKTFLSSLPKGVFWSFHIRSRMIVSDLIWYNLLQGELIGDVAFFKKYL